MSKTRINFIKEYIKVRSEYLKPPKSKEFSRDIKLFWRGEISRLKKELKLLTKG